MSLGPARLRVWWLAAGGLAVLAASLAGLVLGPADLGLGEVLAEMANRLPLGEVDSGLGERQQAIIWEIRLPRVVLGLLVGAMLATAGGAYQGVFRNPLADPYLLGVAAGAGFGVTLAIVSGAGDGVGILDPVPLSAFAGALAAVTLTYLVGATGSRLDPVTSLVLSGVAVASFFTALQTFIQQRESETIRQVYFFVLGQLRTAGWNDVALLAPYTGVCLTVILLVRHRLDALGVGDEEAGSLGLDVKRMRLTTVTDRVRRNNRSTHGATLVWNQLSGDPPVDRPFRWSVPCACRHRGPPRCSTGRTTDRCGHRISGRTLLRTGASNG